MSRGNKQPEEIEALRLQLAAAFDDFFAASLRTRARFAEIDEVRFGDVKLTQSIYELIEKEDVLFRNYMRTRNDLFGVVLALAQSPLRKKLPDSTDPA